MNRPWLQAVGRPELTSDWSLAQWQEATRQLRRLRLLARLAEAVETAGLGPAIPEPVAKLLLAERQTSRYRRRVVAWAATRIARTLQGLDAPLVLLKGSAYMAQELPIAAGRLPSDLDILVPREALPRAQAMLVADGWQEPELDEHDRRYYHEWSHEVPPMQHPMHPVELDLHHNILPPLGPVTIDMHPLLAELRACNWPGWSVLAPVDQVLHSAAHLFFDSEPLERVRDLVDLDGLMRHFAASEADFFAALQQRAQALGLMEPLLLAGHFCSRWLDTPLDAGFRQRLQRRDFSLGVQRALFARVLAPAALDRPRPRSQRAAAAMLLWRYHLRRMPLRLLVPHLWHKLNKARVDPTPQ
jgi:hypothetical protein